MRFVLSRFAFHSVHVCLKFSRSPLTLAELLEDATDIIQLYRTPYTEKMIPMRCAVCIYTAGNHVRQAQTGEQSSSLHRREDWYRKPLAALGIAADSIQKWVGIYTSLQHPGDRTQYAIILTFNERRTGDDAMVQGHAKLQYLQFLFFSLMSSSLQHGDGVNPTWRRTLHRYDSDPLAGLPCWSPPLRQLLARQDSRTRAWYYDLLELYA